jgi:hypothetical protein
VDAHADLVITFVNDQVAIGTLFNEKHHVRPALRVLSDVGKSAFEGLREHSGTRCDLATPRDVTGAITCGTNRRRDSLCYGCLLPCSVVISLECSRGAISTYSR